MDKNILIIGAGEIGSALGKILEKKHKVKYWDKNPKKIKTIKAPKNLADLISWSEIIFLCVPAFAVQDVLKNIFKFNIKNKFLICVSKGINPKTNQRMDEVLKKFSENFGLLYGPMIAEELNQNLKGFGILASKNKKVLDLKNIFLGTQIKIETSTDLVGVALSGILKNIYAIGLGMIDALALGKNFKGFFITKAIEELSMIIRFFKGQKETAYLSSGLGDLIATGSSKNSANYMVGFEIGKKKLIHPSEGLRSLEGFYKLIQSKKIKAKILETIYQIVKNKKDPKNLKELF
jgi:glycerol-3-phosphate dehydrogenase (NAD(P)+)